MQGLINKDGSLVIQRGLELKVQGCKCNSSLKNCGDWCPVFGEPNNLEDGRTALSICDCSTILFDEFSDERLKDDKNTETEELFDVADDVCKAKRQTYKRVVGVVFEGSKKIITYPTSEALFSDITHKTRKNAHIPSELYCKFLNSNKKSGKKSIAKIIRYATDGTEYIFQ